MQKVKSLSLGNRFLEQREIIKTLVPHLAPQSNLSSGWLNSVLIIILLSISDLSFLLSRFPSCVVLFFFYFTLLFAF